ncbi:TonB-linked outer membrane protein, SusC/RagA family [Mucilaginibacter pineti]|uniref:TonB-linked outer membrane protein, SusC/RagA family n=2 Tax=Mucilaginibacter pineti TaxID=1391627 RepID=A0A1G7ES14_9SPHI|nr:TonB-linked outer membrane protein, SusC/RagA family [Mucilaginibacter pineti]
MYKNYTHKTGVLHRQVHKILLIMKLTTFLILIGIMQVSATAIAQKISLSERNTTLSKVFIKISEQSGYDFLFSGNMLKGAKPITIQVKDADLKTVLNKIFDGQPLEYSIEDKSIVVSKKEASTLDKIKTVFTLPMDIHGKVLDESSQPLIGATIQVKGTNESTSTNKNGSFILTNIPDGSILVISYIGFETQEVKAEKNLTISLKANISNLKEVVINKGYYTEKKELSTGSVGVLNASDIEKQPVSNPLLALQGRIPGLIVTPSNGLPGAAVKLQLRGVGSLFNGSDPLFIIDGVPFANGNDRVGLLGGFAAQGGQSPKFSLTGVVNSGAGISPFNNVNLQDIESIEILKDADATAIYGSRGANGVVLITTKKGKAGKTTFSADVYSGMSSVTHFVPMMSTSQYLEMRKEAFKNDGLTPSNIPGDPGYAPDLTVWDQNRYTNWQKWLLGGTAKNTNVNASLTGGDQQTQYLISGIYNYQNTVLPTDVAEKKGGGSVAITHRSLDGKFNYSLSTNYTIDANNSFSPSFGVFLNLPPNLPALEDASGQLVWQQNGVPFDNPMANFLNKYQITTNNLISNFQIGYKILPGLEMRTSFGYNALISDEAQAAPITAQNPVTNPSATGEATWTNSKYTSIIIEPQIEYGKSFSWGKVDVIVGGTYNNIVNKGNYIKGGGYTSDALLGSLSAAPYISLATSNYSDYKYAGFYGRMNFNFREKYIINLTGRRDGSSRFSPERRFNNFGSVGAAWIFSNENIFKDKLAFLTYGKLRGSFGVSGNDQIGNYNYLENWAAYPFPYNNSTSLVPSGLYNPDFVWERDKKTEVALELGFFDNKLTSSITYYQNTSSNQLIPYNLPTQTGFGTILRNFPATIENTGTELELSGVPFKTKAFSWVISANVSIPKNKLKSFPDFESSGYTNLFKIGQPVNVILGYKNLGIDPTTGLYKLQDANGDGSISVDDYQVLGTTDPKFYGGLSNNITYKRFNLSFLFDFKKQIQNSFIGAIQGNYQPGTLTNQLSYVFDRWQNPGDVGKTYQRYSTLPSQNVNDLQESDLALTADASYIKLRNVSFSYSLNPSILERFHFKSCKIYFEGQNLLTISSYKGGDPETHNYNVPPLFTTLVLGIHLQY